MDSLGFLMEFERLSRIFRDSSGFSGDAEDVIKEI